MINILKNYSFDSLVGNVHTISLIRRLLSNGTYKPFTILHGTLGSGKSTSAGIIALSLTCENPKNGNPCGICEMCRRNMKALQTTGESTNVKVINLGAYVNKLEVNNLIKDIFVLKAGERARVYILEEAHALGGLPGAQTALLEELDRVPPNTYVIMCTTKLYDIIPELRSRALTFSFGKLRKEESALLLTSLAGNSLAPELRDLLIKSAHGIPRTLINNLEFVRDNEVTLDEFREFVSEISTEILLELFESMKDKSICSFIQIMTDLCDNREVYEILLALKDFILRTIFYLEGGVTSDFTPEECTRLKEIFSLSQLNKILTLLEKNTSCRLEVDLQIMLYHIRLLIQDREMRDVLQESPKVASVERVNAQNNKIALEQMQTDINKRVLKPLTMNSFGGDVS